jgi:hypothetical protein
MASLAQDAFHRLGPRSCDRETLPRVHLTFARWSFAPFHPPRAGSALSGSEPPGRATSRPLGLPLGSPWSRVEDAPRRLLQPTHDTSTRGSPDSRARRLAPRRPPPSPSPSPFGPELWTTAAPARFLSPRGEGRPSPRWSALDGAVPSFGPFDHSRLTPAASAVGWSGRLPLEGGGHLAAALSAAWEVGERPLTLSVAPRARPGRFDLARFEAPRTASPAPSSKGTASSIQSAFHRQVLPKVSRTVSLARDDSRDDCCGNPPPVSRLCHRRPGFRRAFAIPCSRPEWLDPTSAPEVHHLRTRGAKRRLSTSAIYCDPRAHPTDRPNPAHGTRGRPRAQLFCEPPSFDGGTDCGWPRVLPRGQSRFHGPGAGSRAIRPWRALAPPAAIARGGSFAPTRSARTPPVADSWRRRLE